MAGTTFTQWLEQNDPYKGKPIWGETHNSYLLRFTENMRLWADHIAEELHRESEGEEER